MGHLDQQRKNVRSTEKKARLDNKEEKDFSNDNNTNLNMDAT
jgi:hypothetical protein